MKLKNKNILLLSQAIAAISQGFSFPAQTRVNIIRNAQTLKTAVEVHDKAKQDLIVKLSPDGTGQAIDNDRELLAKFNREYQEIADAVQDIGTLLYLNWSDLEVANVPPAHVSKLGKLVRGLPAGAAGDVIPDTEELA